MTDQARELLHLSDCPRCGHPLDLHNDAGTFGGGQGEMCCYANDTGRQFEPNGEPVKCGCPYDGPGTAATLTEPAESRHLLFSRTDVAVPRNTPAIGGLAPSGPPSSGASSGQKGLR